MLFAFPTRLSIVTAVTIGMSPSGSLSGKTDMKRLLDIGFLALGLIASASTPAAARETAVLAREAAEPLPTED